MTDTVLFAVFQLIVLIFSVIIHEVSHGTVALALGDDTAKRMGRLTLNPLKHLDPVGSVAVPFLLYVFTQGRLMFGWARPVPYDPRFLKNPQMAEGLIAAVGPASNLLIAVLFAGILKASSFAFVSQPLTLALESIIYINLLLGIFNIVPIPPMDGSKVLFSFLPQSSGSLRFRFIMERNGFLILLLFLFFGLPLIEPIVDGLFRLLT